MNEQHLAKQPEPVIKAELKKLSQGDLMNPDLYLQDPCVLNFLYHKSISSERELEDAILSELQVFIQEMGSDFCFVARQKRMSTENNDRFKETICAYTILILWTNYLINLCLYYIIQMVIFVNFVLFILS